MAHFFGYSIGQKHALWVAKKEEGHDEKSKAKNGWPMSTSSPLFLPSSFFVASLSTFLFLCNTSFSRLSPFFHVLYIATPSSSFSCYTHNHFSCIFTPSLPFLSTRRVHRC